MEKKKSPYVPKRKDRIGEDIEMLRERERSERKSDGYAYRDNVDAA